MTKGYTTEEIGVLVEVLHGHMDLLKHYPQEFTDSEAEALEGLYGAFIAEARYRGIVD